MVVCDEHGKRSFMLSRNDIETNRSVRIAGFETLETMLGNDIDEKPILQAFDDFGVVLLRGLNLDIEGFGNFTQNLCDTFQEIGVRHKLRCKEGDGFSTRVFEENFTLLAHTEESFRPLLSYEGGEHVLRSAPPEVCFFMCTTPPIEAGGETTVVDGVAFLAQLPKNLRKRFEQQGIVYAMTWEPERWRNEFFVNDVDELTILLDRIPAVRYDIQGETLNLRYAVDAVTSTRKGKSAFAVGFLAHLPQVTHPKYHSSNVYAKPSDRVYFGDGEELTEKTINILIDIHDDLAYPHRWAAGDILLVDNTRYLHGRTKTKRPCKRSIVSRFGWLRKV